MRLNKEFFRILFSFSCLVKRSVIAIGNPGAGKSAILNALASQIIFRSGLSVGKGLTYKLEQRVVGDIKFCDTPGLADVRQKVEAGIAIRDSLNMGGPHKILFFCKLDDGRVSMEMPRLP